MVARDTDRHCWHSILIVNTNFYLHHICIYIYASVPVYIYVYICSKMSISFLFSRAKVLSNKIRSKPIDPSWKINIALQAVHRAVMWLIAIAIVIMFSRVGWGCGIRPPSFSRWLLKRPSSAIRLSFDRMRSIIRANSVFRVRSQMEGSIWGQAVDQVP